MEQADREIAALFNALSPEGGEAQQQQNKCQQLKVTKCKC